MTDISGAPPRVPQPADFGVVDVKAMPRVVRRIVAAAIAAAPGRVGLAVAASLGAALVKPRPAEVCWAGRWTWPDVWAWSIPTPRFCAVSS